MSVFPDRTLMTSQAEYACTIETYPRTNPPEPADRDSSFQLSGSQGLCGMSACLSSPWRCHGATQLTCKVAGVAIYTRNAQSALSLCLTLLVFLLYLISFLSFIHINCSSCPQTASFSDPPPSSLPPPGMSIQVLVNVAELQCIQ